MAKRLLVIDLDGIGWRSIIQKRRGGTTRVSIKKEVSTGLVLKRGEPAYGYLGRDLCSNRSVIIFYPDGKERDELVQLEQAKLCNEESE